MSTAHLATLFWLIAVASVVPRPATADDARQLMDKVFSRATWKEMQGRLRLTLTNKRGDTKNREIDLWSKKNERGESKMLMRFVKPADVRGTGFLLIEHDDAEDDRRLYLPALRRVNRISASGSGGNFMSSDFTYYDIGRPKLKDWRYTFSGRKEVDGITCRSVTALAASETIKRDTGYSKVVWHVDQQRLIALAADYYDKWGKKLKVMTTLKVELIAKTPFATRMRMKDLTSGHTSDMVFSGLKTNQGLDDRLFTTRNLRKWTR